MSLFRLMILSSMLMLIGFGKVCHAQTDTVYYTYKQEKTTKKWGVFYRIYQKDKDVYRFRSYYLNDSLHMKGALSSLEPEIKHGFFTGYDSLGHPVFKGSYKKNMLQGMVSIYVPGTGKQMLQLTYVNDTANGPAILYDTATGHIAGKGLVVNDERDGEWLFYHYKSDKILASQYYTNGYENGYFAFYYKSGNKMAEGYFAGGRPEGDIVYYYDKPGLIKSKIPFEFGFAEGVQHDYDSTTGKIILEGSYANGKKEGVCNYYYGDGKKLGFDTYKNDELNGDAEYLYPSGKVMSWGTYKFDVPSGKNVSYYADGRLKEVEEFIGSNSYSVLTRYDSATKKAIVKGETFKNKRVGTWYHYAPGTDIVMRKEECKEGLINGTVTMYYANDGRKLGDMHYKNGKETGEWNFVYASGSKWISAYFNENGKLTGELLTYHENGELKRKEVYDGEKKISIKCYDQYGHDVDTTPFLKDASFDGDVSTFIGNELKYPEVSRLQRVEGKVKVSFTVNEDGTISDATIMQSLNGECDKEALRIINAMPKWKPAQIDGFPFSTVETVPIVFWIPEKV